MTNLEKKISFIQEIDKLKGIYRRALIKCDNNRRENTAEHSWRVALMGVILQEYAGEELDYAKSAKNAIDP
ncbi:HD domain-containing protein [Francisella orientalis]|uniref:HD domain-containing protein n=1 Tax=Francisella orientalis TaxID=299583 RepID=UPI0002ECD3B1|nr:HD domain-containing protein [Francisella orientalis]